MRSHSLLGLWHLASFDAPTVAVVWVLGFASMARIRLPIWVPVLLGLVTWSVYIGDRLLDAWSALRSGQMHKLRERHAFHWRHRRQLIPLALGAAFAALCMILALMPRLAMERNSVLAAATLAYFTGVHSPSRSSGGVISKFFSRNWITSCLNFFSRAKSLFTKELLVAFLFTAGCVLPVISRASTVQFIPLAGIAFYFALLAWLNCDAIQRWESGRIEYRASAVTGRGCLLALAGLAWALPLAGVEPRYAALLTAGAASSLLLAVLDRWRGCLTPVTLRSCADLALLTPLALLLR